MCLFHVLPYTCTDEIVIYFQISSMYKKVTWIPAFPLLISETTVSALWAINMNLFYSCKKSAKEMMDLGPQELII